MNFIDRSATYLTRNIRAHNPNAASEKVLFYALCMLINTIIAIVVSLLIAFLTGNFLNSAIVISFYIVLRYCSGGAHMSSSLSCCVVSILIFTAATHLKYDYFQFGIYLDAISFCILLITAPQGIENVSKVNPKYYPLLKLISLALVSSNFIIHSHLLSSTSFVQAFLTTKASYKIIEYVERRFLR